MENAIAIRPMIYKEARECADRISTGINNIRKDVVDLHDREGWSALGYNTWTECVEKEFDQARRYIFYQFAAAQIEQNVSGCTKVHLGTIPETHLRPLAKLTPEKQREAYQQAVETAPEGKSLISFLLCALPIPGPLQSVAGRLQSVREYEHYNEIGKD